MLLKQVSEKKSMSSYIIKTVSELIYKYKTRDPFELIKALGIELMFDGNFSKLKGFYTVMNRQAYIVINANLPEEKRKIVAAHELGHHMLHKRFATGKVMQEFELYDMTARPEYEANCFAAELLVPDEEIIELINSDYDMEQIASILKTDINIIGIKLGNLNDSGKNYNIGILPKGNFLGK